MCHRADYVRDLEANGHSIYGNACLSRASGEQCGLFSECRYLDQFRSDADNIGVENTVRIYTHASLFLARNEYERQITPDLVIIDEAFLSSAVSKKSDWMVRANLGLIWWNVYGLLTEICRIYGIRALTVLSWRR